MLPVHLGHLRDGRGGIAKAKAEIFAGLEPGGTAVINSRQSAFRAAARRAPRQPARASSRSAGTPTADVRADATRRSAPSGTDVAGRVRGRRSLAIALGAPGAHIAHELAGRASPRSMRSAPTCDRGAAGARRRHRRRRAAARAQSRCSTGGTLLLIDESYNANPASMRAALADHRRRCRASDYPRRIAVLGDMLELGPSAADAARGPEGAVDAAGVDLVFACGPHMQQLYDALPPARRGAWAPTSAELVEPLLAGASSRRRRHGQGLARHRMAPLVEALQAHFAATS